MGLENLSIRELFRRRPLTGRQYDLRKEGFDRYSCWNDHVGLPDSPRDSVGCSCAIGG